ncbi:MAG: twin-arginine translocase subunit TatC [Luteolibacter sp.]|uniref:twin-arginine translocase subunit TatC n=1 Tax=Luteolibacter sp. TaxID=1962973 RepID=UPI00326460D6
MYLLKKAIQLRENSHPDHEKPFLEHLEDLRTMITRIVITLVIAMLACFVFNKKIMDFFRLPVDQVLITQIQATLPKDAPRPLTVDLWGEARKVEHAAMNLVPEQREVFYQTIGNNTLVFHAKSIGVLRAATVLPEAKREKFVDSLAETPEFKQQVKALLKSKPNTDSDAQGNLKMMSALKPTEGFMLSMKLSFVAGIVVSFPLLLLFVLQFVLPGMHSHEKRVLWPAMSIGFGLFLAGSAFAYYLVLPKTLLFFYQWSGDMGISNDWRIGEYISFATQFTLLFGASFELPVVVMVFVKLGLLSYETMSKTRSYAIVAIFIAAAVLTPTPDIPTMLLMAAPMIVLYEICIWLAFFDRKKARIREEQEARESAERMLLNEERRRAAAEINDPHDAGWHDDDHHHIEESGDDGWHDDEYPPKDPPVSDELPKLEDEKPHDIPEDEERRRMDP